MLLGNLPSIDFSSALNQAQYNAVTASEGPALVLAGAGSGKTRTLTYRVAFLLSQGIQPSQILLLTFTNKAAKEMLGRVEDLTGVAAHHFWGGTFHHIGHKTLRFHGDLVNVRRSFTILDQNDAENLLADCIRQDNAGFLRNKNNPKPAFIADLISYARNTQQSVEQVVRTRNCGFIEHIELFQHWKELYQIKKIEAQTLDYDDLLELWLQLVQTFPQVAYHYQNRFKYILVDEYQDTNRLQSAIIDILAINHQIMAVGDDAQCIYTWRGAEVDNIFTFPERHPGTQVYKIETNYRSSPEILSFANAIALHKSLLHQQYQKALVAVRSSEQEPLFVACTDTREQAQFIVRQIRLALSEGFNYQDIAILYRAHFQAIDLQMELSRQGIPYLITSGVRFFEQAHIRDLIAQLRFAWNPSDAVAFTRVAALLPQIGSRTAEKLLNLAQATSAQEPITVIQALTHSIVLAKVPAEAKEHWIDFCLTLQNLEEAIHPKKTSRVCKLNQENQQTEEIDLFNWKQHNPAVKKIRTQGESQNIHHVTDACEPSEVIRIAIEGWYGDFLKTLHLNWTSRREDLDNLVGFAQRFKDMGELLTELVLLNSETADRSIDAPQYSVRLTTVHQAKGLEYPVVFLMSLADGFFPLRRAIDEDNIEEERRLFYVAVTRAQNRLVLTYPIISMQGNYPMRQEPSRFIREIPDNLYQMVRIGGPKW